MFLQAVVPIYISAMHHVTGDGDCTAKKSNVTGTICFTDRNTAVVKNPFYPDSSPSEPNVRLSFVSELFANALLFSWKQPHKSYCLSPLCEQEKALMLYRNATFVQPMDSSTLKRFDGRLF